MKYTKLIEALISQAIEREKKFIESCKGNDNPQVVAMRLKAEGRLDALESINRALSGDLVELRIMAQGSN